jgi:hypothetical protein
MGEKGEPPPDPGPGGDLSALTSTSQSQEQSVKSTVTPSRVGDSVKAPKQMRPFHQILAEEKENRNILEIKLTKMMVEA